MRVVRQCALLAVGTRAALVLVLLLVMVMVIVVVVLVLVRMTCAWCSRKPSL
jgi:hypothetical protein